MIWQGAAFPGSVQCCPVPANSLMLLLQLLQLLWESLRMTMSGHQPSVDEECPWEHRSPAAAAAAAAEEDGGLVHR